MSTVSRKSLEMYRAALVTRCAKSCLAHGGAWIPSRITVCHMVTSDLYAVVLVSMTLRYGFLWKQGWGRQLDGTKSCGLGEALTQTCPQCALKVGSVALYSKTAVNHLNWHGTFSATRWSWVWPANWSGFCWLHSTCGPLWVVCWEMNILCPQSQCVVYLPTPPLPP